MDNKPVTPCGTPQADELELINGYTRRTYTAEELYVFSVTLCDNEVDRDYECFTVNALEALAEMYIGKTGIFDHNPETDNQQARIFACKAERVDGKRNSLGEDYVRVSAKAYIPRNEHNAELIAAIDGGIKKEVSIGCAVSKRICSVCGADLSKEICAHRRGNVYDGKMCHVILDSPIDAYEWSFVAVPAQRAAGVTKSYFSREVKNMDEIIKSFGTGEPVCLTADEAAAVGKYIDSLRADAGMGKQYRDDLRKDVLRLCGMAEPGMSEAMHSVCEKMSVDELKRFREFYSDKAAKGITPVPQLYKEKNSGKKNEYRSYSI